MEIEADDVAAGVAHLFQKHSRAGPKMDHRRAGSNPLQQKARVRQNKSPVVLGTQAADPGIKNLHGLNARLDLRIDVLGHFAAQPFHQRAPGAFVAIHQGFGVAESLGSSALDHVGSHRKRRSGKTDQRQVWRQCGARPPDGLVKITE